MSRKKKKDRGLRGLRGFLLTTKKNNIEEPDPSGINCMGHKGTKALSYTSTLDIPCSMLVPSRVEGFGIPTLFAS